MDDLKVRLCSLVIKNFTNTQNGKIVFANPSVSSSESSITGVYGQNGSGKTSIVRALDILKHLMSGDPLHDNVADCIAVNSDSLKIVLDYEIGIDPKCQDGIKDSILQVKYQVIIGRTDEGVQVHRESVFCKNPTFSSRAMKLFDFALSDAIYSGSLPSPVVHWKRVLKKGSSRQEYLVSALLAQSTKRSLLFSSRFGNLLKGLYQDAVDDGKDASDGRRMWLLAMIARASGLFALRSMAVISNEHHAVTSLNVFRLVSHEGEYFGNEGRFFNINLSEPENVTKEGKQSIEKTLSVINGVMDSLVPGFRIVCHSLGAITLDDGVSGYRIELLSEREGRRVPLRCESEGIKKILSILVSLVDVYSNPSACVAIDELDSGVFEMLLGEMLEVLSEHGQGQLIFTAHNLRPLETLQDDSIVLTTVNPENRYIRFSGLKKTNNFRNQYLRALNLGGQAEIIYQPTSKYEIDAAFYDASEFAGDVAPLREGLDA